MAIAPGTFPTDADFERLKQENNWNKLYECEVYDKDEMKGVFRLKELFAADPDAKEILAIALNTPQLIVDAGVKFLFGKPVQVRHKNKDIQKKIDAIWDKNRMQVKLKESAASYQAIGHTQFNVRRDIVKDEKGNDVNEIIIEEVAFDNWFPDFGGVPRGARSKSNRIVSFLTQKVPGEMAKRYIYVMDHFEGRIEHSLWTDNGGRAETQVQLQTMPGLAESIGIQGDQVTMTYTEQTGINEKLCFQVDTQKTVKKRFGRSLLLPIFPLLEEVNDRLTQMSLQFWKNFDPLLEVPSSSVTQDKDGNVKRKSLDVIIKEEGQPDSRYVTNDNPLLDPMMKYVDKFVENCMNLTFTPRSFAMPDDKGGVESAESLKTRFMLFLKRINDYSEVYDEAIRRSLRLALFLLDKTALNEKDLEITFDPGLPKDMKVETEWIAEAYRAGLISRRRAVMMLQNLEGEQLESELKEIDADTVRANKQMLDDPVNGGGPTDGEDGDGQDGDETPEDGQQQDTGNV